MLKHISDRKIHTLILSQCGLTDFPKALLENNFKKISSLQLNDNPHLIELPENIDSMFPNLTYLDISGTGINQSDGIIRLANKELQIINFKNTPLEEDKCKNELISILKKNKYPVKFYDDSSIKIRTPESKTDSASVKKKRSVLLNSAPGVELIMPFSQSKGRPDIVLPDGICAAVCMAASLDFLADNEVEGFLKKLYPNFSKGQRKGRINLSYVKNLIELQGRIDSSTASASYLEQRNMKYSTLRSFPATKSALLVNFLQKKVWDTTEIKAINITLDFTNQSSHRIAFLISNEKNNTGEKAVYFVEANIGMFKIWLKKDSDQLARFFLKYVSPSIQRHKTSEFRVYEVKKTAA
ncbi:hypothetical protein [Candidatus Williamhamiltonella defendens]|uniref:hypothetical protein n=1 Tax=Candidatus Williamhamiltonella defendens TaxID=138072 RepID=UPI001314FC4C|nr:hypothetical protein [Candidatus Hamiltonella defensa]